MLAPTRGDRCRKQGRQSALSNVPVSPAPRQQGRFYSCLSSTTRDATTQDSRLDRRASTSAMTYIKIDGQTEDDGLPPKLKKCTKKKHEDERSVCFAFLSLRLYFFFPSSGNLGFQRTIFVPFLSLGYMGEREGCREKRCCSLWRYMIDRLGAPARTQFRRPSALTHPSELHLLCRIERAGSFHTISSSLNLIGRGSKPFPIMTRLRLRVFLVFFFGPCAFFVCLLRGGFNCSFP